MHGKLKLLIVEDSADDGEAVVSELERGGFSVDWRRVNDAPGLHAALRNRWDIVVSDSVVASMEAPGPLEIVKQHVPELPFVFVCDPMGEECAVALMRAGASDCLRKGHLERLAGTVEQELERAARQREQSSQTSGTPLQQRRYKSIFDTAPVALLEVDVSGASRFMDAFGDADPLGADPSDDTISEDVGFRGAVERIRVLSANRAAVELLGADRPEQLMNVGALRSVQGNMWLDVLRGLAFGAPRFEQQLTLLTLDEREVDVTIAFGLAAGSGHLHSVVLSLVEVARARDLERQILAAQRMDAVGRLAGRVAHDFNNFLTVIKGYSGLLIDTLPEGDPVRDDLRTIDKAASSAERLTRQLSTCNRPQWWEPEPLSVNHLISQLDEVLRGVLGEDIDLMILLADGLWEVEADRSLLEKVLINLAANARHAMPQGGRLTIETGNTRLRGGDRAAMLPGAPDADCVLVTVRDSGCGMDQQTLVRSFEPFFTTRGAHGAEGLGLSVVHGIVKQAGGSIWADSDEGIGSTFHILLPRRRPAAQPVP